MNKSRLTTAALLSTAVLFAAQAAIAQANPVAYPQDGTKTSSGNYTAMGFGTTSSGDEGHYQMMIPARYLPSTGAKISAIEAITIPGTGAVTYASLKITMSHTVATSLSSSFTANLVAPQVVLNASPVTVNWTQSQWTTIPLTSAFVYDGTSNLVIDFQKVIDRVTHPLPGAIFSNATTANPGRRDLPSSRYEFGAFGSGAATSTNARFSSTPLKLRLLVDRPTLTIKSDRAGAYNNVFALGGMLELNIHGLPASPYGYLFDSALAATPTPLGVVAGDMWLNFGVAFGLTSGVLDGLGRDTLAMLIPNSPSLVGLKPAFQAVTLDPAIGLMWTSAVDAIINL